MPNPTDKKKQKSTDELNEGAASLKTKQPSKTTIIDQSVKEVFDAYVYVVIAKLNFVRSVPNSFKDGKVKTLEDFDDFIQSIFGTSVSFVKPGDLASIKQKHKNVIQSINSLSLSLKGNLEMSTDIKQKHKNAIQNINSLKLSLKGNLEMLTENIISVANNWLNEKTLDLSLKYNIFLQIYNPIKPEWTVLHDTLHGDCEYGELKSQLAKEQTAKVLKLLSTIELILQDHGQIYINISSPVNAENSNQGAKDCITIKDCIDGQVKKINSDKGLLIKKQIEFKNSMFKVCLQKTKDEINISEKFDGFIKWMFQDDLKLIEQDNLNKIKQKYKEMIEIVNSAESLKDFEAVTSMLQLYILEEFDRLQQTKIKKLGANLVYLDIEEPDHKAKDSVDEQLQNCSADLPINEESREADSVIDPACSQTVQIDKLPSEVPSTNLSLAQEDLVCQSRRNLSI